MSHAGTIYTTTQTWQMDQQNYVKVKYLIGGDISCFIPVMLELLLEL
jgi:hypothetical protein